MGRRNIGDLSPSAVVASILVAVAAATGCGSGDALRRHAVRGTVTYQGKPVPSGEVTFEPDSRAGNKGPASRGDITDGSYSIGRPKGHLGGPYIVRVTGYGTDTTPTADGPAPVPLFDQYEQSLDLPKGDTTQDIDVVQKPRARR